jgi:hypothetical protein
MYTYVIGCLKESTIVYLDVKLQMWTTLHQSNMVFCHPSLKYMITKIVEHTFCDVTMSHDSCMMLHDIIFLVNVLTISQLRNLLMSRIFFK